MTIERVKQIAHKDYGVEMTDDMAEKYIAKYSDKLGKLSDDELDNVSGGYTCRDKEFWQGKYCEPCGVWCDHHTGPGDKYDTHNSHTSLKCPVCGTIYV